MLDLSIYLCTTIRKDSLQFISPLFESLIYNNLEYVNNMNTSVSSKLSKASDIYENSTDELGDLIIVTKGVKGMIINILLKYKIKSSNTILLSNNNHSKSRARSRSRSKSPMRIRATSAVQEKEPVQNISPMRGRSPIRMDSQPPQPPHSPSMRKANNDKGRGGMFSSKTIPTPKSSINVNTESCQIIHDEGTIEEVISKDPNVETELQVEVIAATRIKVIFYYNMFVVTCFEYM